MNDDNDDDAEKGEYLRLCDYIVEDTNIVKSQFLLCLYVEMSN
jgi:hypothetical protein